MLLRSLAFPLRDDITAAKVTDLCKEVHRSDLATFYLSDNKPFLRMENWTERARSDSSKYPDFDNTCQQMFSDVVKCSLPKSKSKPSSSPLVLDLPPEAVLWNDNKNLPAVKAMSNARTQKLNARRKDPFWVENLPSAIERICKSGFCTGTNDRNWRADFDFILQPDTVAKVMEGKYDNRAPAAPASPAAKESVQW